MMEEYIPPTDSMGDFAMAEGEAPMSSSYSYYETDSAFPPVLPSGDDWGPYLMARLHLLAAFALQCRETVGLALASTWVASKAWWQVIVLFGRPVLRFSLYLWTLVLPYLRWFGRTFFNHLKEQEPQVLLCYAGFVGSIIVILFVRHLLKRLKVYDRLRAYVQGKVAVVGKRYQQGADRLRQYSRRAAEALPHVLFALAAVSTSWLFPVAVHRASQEVVFNIVLLYLPAIATFFALQPPRSSPSSSPPAGAPKPGGTTALLIKRMGQKEQYKEWLLYWVVTALVLALRGVAEQLWLRWLMKMVPWAAEVLLFLAFWLHIPHCGGTIMRQHLYPRLQQSLGGLLWLHNYLDNFIHSITKVAAFTRLISQKTADRLNGHIDEILLVVPAAIVTLSPLAGWGLLFISLLFPAYATVRALGGKELAGAAPPTDPAVPWLRYWVVYSLSHLLFQAMPFWSAIQMWYFIWLLIPHFDGLPIVLDGRNLLFEVLSNLYHPPPKEDRRKNEKKPGSKKGDGKKDNEDNGDSDDGDDGDEDDGFQRIPSPKKKRLSKSVSDTPELGEKR